MSTYFHQLVGLGKVAKDVGEAISAAFPRKEGGLVIETLTKKMDFLESMFTLEAIFTCSIYRG